MKVKAENREAARKILGGFAVAATVAGVLALCAAWFGTSPDPAGLFRNGLLMTGAGLTCLPEARKTFRADGLTRALWITGCCLMILSLL